MRIAYNLAHSNATSCTIDMRAIIHTNWSTLNRSQGRPSSSRSPIIFGEHMLPFVWRGHTHTHACRSLYFIIIITITVISLRVVAVSRQCILLTYIPHYTKGQWHDLFEIKIMQTCLCKICATARFQNSHTKLCRLIINLSIYVFF